MQLQGQVGPKVLQDGASDNIRLGRSSEIIVTEVHGKYYETTFRGNVFHACTATSGVAPGTTIGTTAPFSLYNPSNSGKNLVVIKAFMAYVSGTLGSGTTYLVANIAPQAAATTGTAITAVCGLLGSGNQPTGKPFTTATLPVSPSIVKPFCTLTPILASSVTQPYQVFFDLDAAIIVGQGCTLSLESVAGAGSTPLVVFGMSWEEVSV